MILPCIITIIICMNIDYIFSHLYYVVHLCNDYPPKDYHTMGLFLSLQLFHAYDLALSQIRAKSHWENVLEFQSNSF